MTLYERIISVVREKLQEDAAAAPTNAAGSGAVASIGVGAQGEPPGKPKKSTVLKRKPINVDLVS